MLEKKCIEVGIVTSDTNVSNLFIHKIMSIQDGHHAKTWNFDFAMTIILVSLNTSIWMFLQL